MSNVLDFFTVSFLRQLIATFLGVLFATLTTLWLYRLIIRKEKLAHAVDQDEAGDVEPHVSVPEPEVLSRSHFRWQRWVLSRVPEMTNDRTFAVCGVLVGVEVIATIIVKTTVSLLIAT